MHIPTSRKQSQNAISTISLPKLLLAVSGRSSIIQTDGHLNSKALILIVEDDPAIRNLISVALESHEYRYLIVPNAGSAILEASSHNPDIMLLDLGLPDLDGVEVIRKIRSWSNMPIIVISARSDDIDKIEALDAGADDYLTKPFPWTNCWPVCASPCGV